MIDRNRSHRITRLALVTIAMLLPVAFASTPQVKVFAVPDEGEGPLEVKIIVRTTNTDPSTLYCKLSTWGDDGPYEKHHFFTLEPPYPEVVFTHVYDASDTDYRPTVRCQDAGITSASSPVTVHNPPANGAPEVSMSGPMFPMDAADPITFTIESFDPDGETLHCNVDFDEFASEPMEFTIEAPYNDLTLEHRFGRPSVNGQGYEVKFLCRDGHGGAAHGSQVVDVYRSPGNSDPSFTLRRLTTRTGTAPRNVGYRLESIHDSSSDSLYCHFDAKDGSGRQFFTVHPPYNNVSLDGYYTEPMELGFPVAACTDGRGGYNSSQTSITVHEAAGNQDPLIVLTPSTTAGSSPLDVTFTLHTGDANGDRLSCLVDYGLGEETEEIQVQAPYNDVVLQHRFDSANSYQVSMECKEDRGGSSREAVWIEVDPYEPPTNYDPIVRISATPDSGNATLGVSFFVNGEDPDGADIVCDIDYADGTNPKTVYLEAPLYSQEWLTHSFFTAATTPYPVTMMCSDGAGGEATKVVQVQVDRADSNEEPWIGAFFASPSSGVAPLQTTFTFTADDVDTSVLACTLDYGDGNASNWRTSAPLSINRVHTYAEGTYEARLYCCDDVSFGTFCGADNVGVAASSLTVVSGSGNQAPTLSVSTSATSGLAPLNVVFDVVASDPDGHELNCDFDPGTGIDSTDFTVSSPAPMSVMHTFSLAGEYEVAVFCHDRFGGTASETVSISVQPPGGQKGENRDTRTGDGGSSEVAPDRR